MQFGVFVRRCFDDPLTLACQTAVCVCVCVRARLLAAIEAAYGRRPLAAEQLATTRAMCNVQRAQRQQRRVSLVI